MVKDMSDGVILWRLLEACTGEHIRGIDKHPKNPLAAGANLNIIWKFMRKEGIELGGITPLSVQQGKNERTVLALLWRFIQKYDFEGVDSPTQSLLDWVNNRTKPGRDRLPDKYREVRNFERNWANGVAFLALFDSIVPGHVDMASVDSENVDENLQRAFDFFESELLVPQMLTVDDMTKGKPDKSSVMTYVAAIRNAAQAYDAAQEARGRAGRDANARHKADGDALFQRGLAKLTKTSNDGEEKVSFLIENFKNRIEEGDGADATYKAIKDELLRELDPFDKNFDEAASLFDQAKVEYQQGGEACEDMVAECESRAGDTGEQKRILRKRLQDGLDEAEKENREDRIFSLLVEEFKNVIASNQTDLLDIIRIATEEIEGSSNETERKIIDTSAHDKVEILIKKLDKINIHADEVVSHLEGDDITDGAKEKLLKITEIKEQIKVLPDKYRKLLDERLKPAMDKAVKDDANQANTMELLQKYHDFSVTLDSISGRMEADDPGISKDASSVRSRLECIYNQMISFYDMEAELREKVQRGVDDVFDQHGCLGEHWVHPHPGGVVES